MRRLAAWRTLTIQIACADFASVLVCALPIHSRVRAEDLPDVELFDRICSAVRLRRGNSGGQSEGERSCCCGVDVYLAGYRWRTAIRRPLPAR